ncbi:hypothetical protein KY310_00675 [Candidatus Woesearchaeota archaeon]|nr:hypothetical protein [Candidatus Woesearchaeota archaeon]
MSKTPQELYEQAKNQTTLAIELTRAGNLNDLGPALSRLEATFTALKKADPELEVIGKASREYGEGPVAIRVLSYANDTRLLAAQAHLVAAEKALKAGDAERAREVYKMIAQGTDFRIYLDAQRLPQNNLNARAQALDKKIEELQ